MAVIKKYLKDFDDFIILHDAGQDAFLDINKDIAYYISLEGTDKENRLLEYRIAVAPQRAQEIFHVMDNKLKREGIKTHYKPMRPAGIWGQWKEDNPQVKEPGSG